MPSYLLSAAIEVRRMIFQYITRPSDLKSLCLICKELSAITIPVLYFQVDLTPREKTQTEHLHDLDPIPQEQIRRIKALLSNKKNLEYIRVLITSECDTKVTNLLNKLLKNLNENQLLELHYGNKGLLSRNALVHRTENLFPSAEQMELLWIRQRKLQTCYSQHVSTLSRALNTKRLQANVVFSPLKDLILIEEQLDPRLIDLIKRSFQKGYIPALRKLKLAQWRSDGGLQTLHDLFAARGFVNLTEIYVRDITFRTKFEVANCPMLKALTIYNCRILSDVTATLSIPKGVQLKSLHYVANDDIAQYTLLAPIMQQIKGLESLVLELMSPETEDESFSEEEINQFRSELASALEMHQQSLTELVVLEEQPFETSLVFGGEKLFQAIRGCGKLFRLAVALGVEDPVPRYSRLIQDLPRLAYCWLMHCFDYVPDDVDEAEIPIQFKNAIPVNSTLRFFGYSWTCYSRQDNENNEPTDQDEPDANIAGTALKRLDWKNSNAMFYNRYPCDPLLPVNRVPSDEFLRTQMVSFLYSITPIKRQKLTYLQSVK